MPFVGTRISIYGFTEAEVRNGIEYLLEEFRERPWIIRPDAAWTRANDGWFVTTHYEGDDPDACGQAASDEVWDCAIACIYCSSIEIDFTVEESAVVHDP